MTIPLEALTTFSYDGHVVVRGQEFLARTPGDAKVLTLLQKAKFATHDALAPLMDEEKPKRKRRREAE